MTKSPIDSPAGLRGSLLDRCGFWLVFAALAVYVGVTAMSMRDPLHILLQSETLAVFARAETHNWYRTVVVLTALDVAGSFFIVAGAGWLALLGLRRSRKVPEQVQAWLAIGLAMRAFTLLASALLARVIGFSVEVGMGSFFVAVVAVVGGWFLVFGFWFLAFP